MTTALALTPDAAPDTMTATRRADTRALSLAVVAAALQVRIYVDLGEPERAALALADTRKALAGLEPRLRDAATMQAARAAHQLRTRHLADRARRAERVALSIEADPGASTPRRPPGRPPRLGPWLPSAIP